MGIWLMYTAGVIASVVAYITQDGKPHIPTMTSPPEIAKVGSPIGLSATDPLNELNSLERTRTRASHERERRMTADINSKRPYHRTYASPARRRKPAYRDEHLYDNEYPLRLKPMWKPLAARRSGYYKPSIEDYDDYEMEQQPMRRAISKRPRYGTSEYFWPFQSAMKRPYRTMNSNRYIPVEELSIDPKTDDNIYDAQFDGGTGGTRAVANHPSHSTAVQNGNADSLQTTNGIEHQPHSVYTRLSPPAPHINKYLQVATPALPLSTRQYAAVQRAAPLFSDLASEYYYGSSGNLNGVFDSLQCFSGDMTVETPDGTREIRSLKRGEKVLSIEGSFISYSPVIMFLHRLENETAEFNLIATEGNLQLKLTDFHLIYVTNCADGETLRLTHSKNVRKGQCLHVIGNDKSLLTPTKVVNITRVIQRGIYAPLTAAGDIIVNSMLSSCHSNAVLQTLQQTFFFHRRRLNSWLTAEDDNNEQNGELPLGVEYLTSILDALIPIETFI
uniref:Warthog protein 6 n=1 Tax=Ascaris suum TaxID=6253 RepID=F1L4M9_ASCSU